MDPDIVGEHINECITNDDSDIDLDHDGWVSVNDILIEEGHAYKYFGGKKKDFEAEMVTEKAQAKLIKGKEERENQLIDSINCCLFQSFAIAFLNLISLKIRPSLIFIAKPDVPDR